MCAVIIPGKWPLDQYREVGKRGNPTASQNLSIIVVILSEGRSCNTDTTSQVAEPLNVDTLITGHSGLSKATPEIKIYPYYLFFAPKSIHIGYIMLTLYTYIFIFDFSFSI